jgi:hypothetical protein
MSFELGTPSSRCCVLYDAFFMCVSVVNVLDSWIALQADTKVSPRTMLPSVKILALKVNLGVFKEVQMLFSFIRCFPNIETLHVEVTI